MVPGVLLGDRFEIEDSAGSGGVGEVFRARDRAAGKLVAVKVLRRAEHSGVARFEREVAVLAEISHPAVVRYVAHGVAPDGAPYLVMEWLDGEDLAARLRRRALSIAESLTVAARVAAALTALHDRGILHRDVKPSNVFLVERDPSRVKLLDFGLARAIESTFVTQSGTLFGTPGYMAPEQAAGGDLDSRTDVYGLGCVLFECLAGGPVFSGSQPMGVLAKVLFTDAPRVTEIRPDTPPAVDDLVARMLSRDPSRRPRDGAQVLEALESMEPVAGASALTRHERRVQSVVLLTREPGAGATVAELRREAAAHGGELESLADGTLVVTLTGTGLASDLAASAARSALSLRGKAGSRAVAVATGRAELGRRVATGDPFERAARLVGRPGPGPSGAEPVKIAIDDVTANLLDARFAVAETREGFWLEEEQELAEGARRVLGKVTPFVGRDWELSTLEGLFEACVGDSRARAVLVTASAGTGKSRLAYELLRRLRRRAEPVSVWIARGDPLRSGAALGLLGQAIRSASGIRDGEPDPERRDKLAARAAELVGRGEARQAAEFLGEIAAVPFPDDESPALHAARRDAQLMADQTRRAWVDLVDAASATSPVLLVLEDLHWSDLPTVRFVDEALRRVRDRPWMVLGLARPEVHEAFPNLWADRQVHEIRLTELSPRASGRLVRQLLGNELSTEAVERLVAQAEGNAFYLEELIRSAAEGRRGSAPETVLAAVQSRIEALDGPARRLLRAGSVLGKVFWRGAAETLLGGGSVGEELDRLERLEWISTRAESRFAEERELSFQHALVREAAYGMLTDADLSLGHRLAGEWLERAGEPSAAVIAEHYHRGGDRPKAAVLYRRSAAQALAANDFSAALSRAGWAVSLGADPAARGELLQLQSEAHHWRGELSEAHRAARLAMDVLPEGSALWFDAARTAGLVAGDLGKHDDLAVLTDRLASVFSEEALCASAMTAASMIVVTLLFASQHERAAALFARIEPFAARFEHDPSVSGLVCRARGMREIFAGRPGAGCALLEQAILHHERAGNLRRAISDRNNVATQKRQLGQYPESVTTLRAALASAERMGLDFMIAVLLHNLGSALGHQGLCREAREVEERAVALFAAQQNRRLEGGARTYLAAILLSAGDLESAETEARRAVALPEVARSVLVMARATLADVLLARGEVASALAEAESAVALLAEVGEVEEGATLARVVLAECLFATGQEELGRAVVAEARAKISAVAEQLAEPATRASFLTAVSENARAFALGSRRSG